METAIWFKLKSDWISGDKPIIPRAKTDRRISNKTVIIDRRKSNRRKKE